MAILRPVLTWVFCYPVASAMPQYPNLAVRAPWIAFLIDSIVRDRLLNSRVKKREWLEIKLS